ncbi:MAG: hypothetical protein WC744_04445 [Patescibacteria group bacterium]|jgi:hypothetical protein
MGEKDGDRFWDELIIELKNQNLEIARNQPKHFDQDDTISFGDPETQLFTALVKSDGGFLAQRLKDNKINKRLLGKLHPYVLLEDAIIKKIDYDNNVNVGKGWIFYAH